MDEKLRRVYVPMTETGFYILFSLQEERHGYHVIQYVKKITDNEIIISAGTLYGTLSKMEKDQLIRFTREEEKENIIKLQSLAVRYCSWSWPVLTAYISTVKEDAIMETKRIFRFFSLAEYGEEQKFLEEMHQKGWKLKSYTVFRGYVFEKCIPENWIYQLDYRDEVEDLNAYIQLFQDCGWEYVMMFNSFYYFRRKENGEENNSEIFSDRETRREYCESIYKRSVFLTLFCAIIFSIIIVPGLWKALQMFERDPWFLVVYSLISGIMLFELLFLIKCTLKLYAAKKEQEST